MFTNFIYQFLTFKCMKKIAILLLLLLTACSLDEFGSAVNKISKIDKANNISFSDYSNGLEYLRTHPRYPDPLNLNEIDPILEKYNKISGSEAVNLYVSFRRNLLLSEKYHQLAYKTYKGVTEEYGIRCSWKDYILESIDNQKKCVEAGTKAVKDIRELKEKYPDKFNQLNISDEWLTNTKNFYIDYEGDVGKKENDYRYFCVLNMTKKINMTNKNSTR